jgi:hypothetical protein
MAQALAATLATRSTFRLASLLPCLAIFLFGALLAGCETTTTISRTSGPRVVDEKLFDKEVDGTRVAKATRLDSVEVKLGHPDILEAHVSKVSDARFDEYKDWYLAFSRESDTSGAVGNCVYDAALSPFIILGAVLGDDLHDMVSDCTGDKAKASDEKEHPKEAPARTGRSSTKEVVEAYTGPVSLSINGGKALQVPADAGVVRVPVAELRRLAGPGLVDIDLSAPFNPQPASLHASVDELRLAALGRQIAQAEQAAAAAAQQAAADQERAQQEEREAQENAQRQQDDADNAAMTGMLMGAFAAKATGNADLATQVAVAAGGDADAAKLGATMAIQQQQQALDQAAQLRQQQKDLSAQIAQQQQQRLAAQQAANEQRAVQLASLQAQQQESEARLHAQAQERATQQRAFATQCLKVQANYIQPGNPSLNIREVQHFTLKNNCTDDVWAFIMDRTGNGEGGVVGAGNTREFVFFDKGHGWMKDYKGCIVKYDVDHQCEGNENGLGGY